MNYKLTTYLLLILLIAVSIYHLKTTQSGLFSSPEPTAGVAVTNQDKAVEFFGADFLSRMTLMNEKLSDSLNQDTSRFSRTHGKIRSARDSQKKLQRLLFPQNPSEKYSYNYGFSFGYDAFKEFCQYVDSLSELSDIDRRGKLIGVRAYKGVSVNSKTNELYEDLFLIPVLADGYDYPRIHNFKDNSIETYNPSKGSKSDDDYKTLNISAPCPTKCDNGKDN